MSTNYNAEMEIELCGEKLKLRGSFAGLLEIEKRAGMGINLLVMKMAGNEMSLLTVASIIYGGLIGAGNKSYTFEQVGEKVLKHGYIKMIGPCGNFIAQAMTAEESKDESSEKK